MITSTGLLVASTASRNALSCASNWPAAIGPHGPSLMDTCATRPAACSALMKASTGPLGARSEAPARKYVRCPPSLTPLAFSHASAVPPPPDTMAPTTIFPAPGSPGNRPDDCGCGLGDGEGVGVGVGLGDGLGLG